MLPEQERILPPIMQNCLQNKITIANNIKLLRNVINW